MPNDPVLKDDPVTKMLSLSIIKMEMSLAGHEDMGFLKQLEVAEKAGQNKLGKPRNGALNAIASRIEELSASASEDDGSKTEAEEATEPAAMAPADPVAEGEPKGTSAVFAEPKAPEPPTPKARRGHALYRVVPTNMHLPIRKEPYHRGDTVELPSGDDAPPWVKATAADRSQLIPLV